MPGETYSYQSTVEGLTDNFDITTQDAEVFTQKNLVGKSSSEIADDVGISDTEVTTALERANNQITLPNIDKVESVPEEGTGSGEGDAWEITFENGSKLRYVWDDDEGDILKEMIHSYSPHPIDQQIALKRDQEDLDRCVLYEIEEYTCGYRDDPTECAIDREHIFKIVIT